MNKCLLSPLFIALLSTQAISANLPSTEKAPDTTSTITSTPATPPAPIDCHYHIPANQSAIESTIISTWAEKATLQSFHFTPTTIQNQLDDLKACYTEQGWKGFNEALQKSGNVDSIKAQQLTVSSQADGASNVEAIKDNQWRVMLPIQVVYQNDKEKVTQKLSVTLLIGRKSNGDLGIMQLVATAQPDQGTSPEQSAPTEAAPNAHQDMQPSTQGAHETPSTPATQTPTPTTTGR